MPRHLLACYPHAVLHHGFQQTSAKARCSLTLEFCLMSCISWWWSSRARLLTISGYGFKHRFAPGFPRLCLSGSAMVRACTRLKAPDDASLRCRFAGLGVARWAI